MYCTDLRQRCKRRLELFSVHAHPARRHVLVTCMAVIVYRMIRDFKVKGTVQCKRVCEGREQEQEQEEEEEEQGGGEVVRTGPFLPNAIITHAHKRNRENRVHPARGGGGEKRKGEKRNGRRGGRGSGGTSNVSLLFLFFSRKEKELGVGDREKILLAYHGHRQTGGSIGLAVHGASPSVPQHRHPHCCWSRWVQSLEIAAAM